MAGLDEDAMDEILYLARANEATELESYLSELSAQTKQSKAELLTAAVDPYSKNSALHYAAANGHNDIIKLLFSMSNDKPAHAFLNALNESGNTPLHWAALNGHLESVKILVQSGADVTIINRAGHDAVYEAEINDKSQVVDWLLGAVEELENGIGQTGEAASGDDADEGMDDADADDADDARALTQGTAAKPSVEGIRKQMENLDAKDGGSRDG
ncbi:ankyrin [Decorospora gaudefroyi]|uniref:Ankyrin n=1 Tax=Decorospora gaudefroyi TaxID=184978 RepID=A0A6A5K4L5_9PLEO|nr:ankyrin [Decorospora gaudefroyi]